MKHKIVLIQNLEKVREELAKTRHDKDLLEQRVQQAEALLRDSRGDCSRKEKEWRADQRELLGQIRDLEAEVAVMRGVGGYIRKQSTSSERIRSQHQVERTPGNTEQRTQYPQFCRCIYFVSYLTVRFSGRSGNIGKETFPAASTASPAN